MHDPLILNVPPKSPEAERAVLGAMLIDSSCIDELRAMLKGADFYNGAHARIFASILELHGAGAVDVVLLNEDLARRGVLDQVGGTVALAELTEAVPTSANAAYYAKEVRSLALKRRVIEATARAQKVVWETPSWTGEEAAREAERLVLEATQDANDESAPKRVGEFASDVFQAYCAAESSTAPPGLQTGLLDLDDMTGGIRDGQLVIIGARPSHGKTSLVLTILRNLARAGTPVALFSLEIPSVQIAQNVAIAEAGVRNTDARRGRLRSQDRSNYLDGIQALEGLPLYVDESDTVEAICARARFMVAKLGVKLIAVDYVQKVRSERRFTSSYERISHVSDLLMKLAKKTCPVIAAAQLGRDLEKRRDRRAGMADLKGCGELEQDAHQIWLLNRPHVWDQEAPPQEAHLRVAKARGSYTGELQLTFRPEQEAFVSYRGPR